MEKGGVQHGVVFGACLYIVGFNMTTDGVAAALEMF